VHKSNRHWAQDPRSVPAAWGLFRLAAVLQTFALHADRPRQLQALTGWRPVSACQPSFLLVPPSHHLIVVPRPAISRFHSLSTLLGTLHSADAASRAGSQHISFASSLGSRRRRAVSHVQEGYLARSIEESRHAAISDFTAAATGRSQRHLMTIRRAFIPLSYVCSLSNQLAHGMHAPAAMR
jgi:hypothetical protein